MPQCQTVYEVLAIVPFEWNSLYTSALLLAVVFYLWISSFLSWAGKY